MDTNVLTQEILSRLVPKMALIAYENDTAHGDKYFLEMRPIGNDGTMGAGVPVTVEFLRDIAENYSGKDTSIPSGPIPANLLYADTRKGSELYVWYNRPQKRKMFFVDSLGIPDGEYHVPGVIYEVRGNGLYVYAFTDEVPTPETKLFQAPFFNTSNTGVCLGSAALKRPSSPTFEQMIGYWEDRFWLSKFSHTGNNSTKSGIKASTLAAADKPFDIGELKSAGLKLKTIFK